MINNKFKNNKILNLNFELVAFILQKEGISKVYIK